MVDEKCFLQINPTHGHVTCGYCAAHISSCRCLHHGHIKVKGTCKRCRKKDFERLEEFVQNFIKEKKIKLK